MNIEALQVILVFGILGGATIFKYLYQNKKYTGKWLPRWRKKK